MTTRRSLWKLFLLIIPFGVLYRSTAASQFSYDGVLYALDVEYGTTAQLFHPGHLLYSFLLKRLYQLVSLFGYSGRAIFLMQSANAWIGALAVALFAVTLARRFGTTRGFLVASLFGLSQVFWGESIDPGCYALTGLAAVCLLNVLLRARESNAWRVGLLHGVLILIHQLLILVIPAFWVAIRFGDPPRVRRGVHYTTGVLMGAGIPYACVAALFHPGPFSERLFWFLIPAGTPTSMGVLDNSWWNWNGLANVRPFCETFVQGFLAQVPWGTMAVGLLVIYLLAGSYRQFMKRSALCPDLAVSWMWVIPVGLFLFFFNHAIRFQVLLLPPVLCLLAALSTKFHFKGGAILSVAGLLLLGTVNYSRAIAPRRSGGVQQARILWLRDRVSPNDFLLFAGRGPHSLINVYAAYFLPQIPARSLYGYLLAQFGRSETNLDPLTAGCEGAWSRGGRVWVEKDLLEPEVQKEAETQMKVAKGSVSRWFKKFKGVREVPGPDGYCLEELKPAFQVR